MVGERSCLPSEGGRGEKGRERKRKEEKGRGRVRGKEERGRGMERGPVCPRERSE